MSTATRRRAYRAAMTALAILAVAVWAVAITLAVMEARSAAGAAQPPTEVCHR